MNKTQSLSYRPRKSNNVKTVIKEHLSLMATRIKVDMDENQILTDTINNLHYNIHKSKEQIKKFASLKNKEQMFSELNKHLNTLKLSNQNLKKQKKYLFQKYIKLINKHQNELEPFNIELNLLSDRKFILSNLIKSKENIIRKITDSINTLKFIGIREEEKEIITNNLDMDEDFYILKLEKMQTDLLNKLKSYNKVSNKCNILKENIKILNDAINFFEKKELKLPKDEQIKVQKNEIMIESNKDEYLSTNEFNDSILSENNDDEDNLQFLIYDQYYHPLKLKNSIKIPKINLEQINYNKKKNNPEDNEKSLSREMEKCDEIQMKIKSIKKKVKVEKNKLKNYKKKCIIIMKKLKSMEEQIKSLKKINIQEPHIISRNRNNNYIYNKQFKSTFNQNRNNLNIDNKSLNDKCDLSDISQ